MKSTGLIFNTKKLYVYFIMLIIGFSLIFYSIITYAVQMSQFQGKISDEEIIERAKGLGMIDLKEYLNSKGKDE